MAALFSLYHIAENVQIKKFTLINIKITLANIVNNISLKLNGYTKSEVHLTKTKVKYMGINAGVNSDCVTLNRFLITTFVQLWPI